MNRRVLIIGGSLAGLLAGNLFHRRGWEVQVFERAAGDLEGRGAGITILPGLVDGFRAAGAQVSEEMLGIVLPARMALNREGVVVAEHRFAQAMTSWGLLYESLRKMFPSANYHGGATLARVEQDTYSVTAVFADGQRVSGDLLVGADGLRSVVRSQFLPALIPHYAGYVAWRCLTDEAALPATPFARLFERYTVCVAPGEQAIGYPVPGPDHSKAVGRRQYNVVWYHPVREPDELRRFMTDDSGRHHPNGIPPALLSVKLRDEMIDLAPGVLAPPFAEAIRLGRMHFFQPIQDIEPPRLVFGRVAIVGDAAFVTRPHVAMGVPKGAGDVRALAQALDDRTNIAEALENFESQRLRVGRNIVVRGRYLGSYMEAQVGDDAQREAAERARVPRDVMMETAAPLNYGG